MTVLTNATGVLTRKYGPLPLWAYGVIGGVGIGIYLRRRNANAVAQAPTVAGSTTDTTTGDAIDASGEGYGSTSFPSAGISGFAPPNITINLPPLTGGGGDTPAGSGGLDPSVVAPPGIPIVDPGYTALTAAQQAAAIAVQNATDAANAAAARASAAAAASSAYVPPPAPAYVPPAQAPQPGGYLPPQTIARDSAKGKVHAA